MSERCVGWTNAQIDEMLAAVRKRHAVATHEGWMNRLLDARKYHRT